MLNGNRDLFYPRYSYSRATHTAQVSHTFTSVATHVAGSGVAHESREAAVRRGTLLDAQIERTTMLFKRHKLAHAYFYDAAFRDAWVTTNVPLPIKRYIGRILPHARACWQTMERLHLSPVATQVPVGCIYLHRATMIDLVCIDTSQSIVKQYIPIEIKSGFNNYYYNCTDHMMSVPFDKQTDCLFNQHQLQLLVGAELYRRSFWKGNRGAMGTPLLMRFRTDDDGNVVSDVHPLRQWAIDALPAALAVMMKR